MTTRGDQVTAWGYNLGSEMVVNDADVAPDLLMFAGFGNVGVAVTAEGLVIMGVSSRTHAKEIIKRMRVRTRAPFRR